jgi:hypothetical protein
MHMCSTVELPSGVFPVLLNASGRQRLYLLSICTISALWLHWLHRFLIEWWDICLHHAVPTTKELAQRNNKVDSLLG